MGTSSSKSIHEIRQENITKKEQNKEQNKKYIIYENKLFQEKKIDILVNKCLNSYEKGDKRFAFFDIDSVIVENREIIFYYKTQDIIDAQEILKTNYNIHTEYTVDKTLNRLQFLDNNTEEYSSEEYYY